MIKKIITVVLLVFALVATSYAGVLDCPPGQERKGWKCVDIEIPDGNQGFTSNITNNNDNSNRNTNMNTNLNSNSNKNTNVNMVGQKQGQAQAQLQGQGQIQGQTAHNEGVVQDVEINQVDNTVTTVINFHHITPDIGRTDADLTDGADASKIKTVGIYNSIDTIALVHAKRMARHTFDYEIFESVLMEKSFRVNMIARGQKGMLMGTMTIVSTGDDSTVDGLFARALVRAMKLGATHFTVIDKADGLYHTGSKAGIDFGGAASVASKSDGSVVIAPGGTLGYSYAWSSNEYRSGMTFALYFDESAIND